MSEIHKHKTKVQYPSLHGLRAVSILIVIFHHIESQYSIFSNMLPSQFRYFYDFLTDGQLGVNVFFVISGFLITSLLITEENESAQISLKNFYIRRTLRIFPAYYVYLGVLFMLQLSNILSVDNSAWLTAITYTKYFNWKIDWFTAHAWSLSIEEHFYLFFPLLFRCRDKVRKNIVWMFVLCVPLVTIFTYYFPVSWMNNLTIFKRIDALAIGCLIAFYQETLLQLLGKKMKILFYLSIGTIICIGFVPEIAQVYQVHLGFTTLPLGTRYGTLANIAIGIILLYSVFGDKGLWYRLLNNGIMKYIGLLSYSLYLWQQLFLSGGEQWAFSLPQNIVFALVCALLSYYFIEKPFLKLKDKFSGNLQ